MCSQIYSKFADRENFLPEFYLLNLKNEPVPFLPHKIDWDNSDPERDFQLRQLWTKIVCRYTPQNPDPSEEFKNQCFYIEFEPSKTFRENYHFSFKITYGGIDGEELCWGIPVDFPLHLAKKFIFEMPPVLQCRLIYNKMRDICSDLISEFLNRVYPSWLAVNKKKIKKGDLVNISGVAYKATKENGLTTLRPYKKPNNNFIPANPSAKYGIRNFSLPISSVKEYRWRNGFKKVQIN